MISLEQKKDCCGCGACMNACPKGCITMKADQEGFLYPIVEKEKCIACGKCRAVCPVLNLAPEQPKEQTAFIVQHQDEKIRRESTAGGAFTAIATYAIRRGGVAYGAAFDEELMVKHVSAQAEENLKKFRGSKYVQSDTGFTFSEVRTLLQEGKWVCYSGTPCQVEGLKKFLGREYETLITVDVVCHAIPSPLVWRKYLEMQQEKLGDFSRVSFRDKHYGYKYSTMSFFRADGKKIYAQGIDTDPMTRAFFSDICDRPSCYDCVFKKRYRVSDFTIWDCFSVYQFNKKMDDDMGTTRVLIHSEKGRRVFEEVKAYLSWHEVDADALTKGVREMIKSVNTNPRREEFFAQANVLGGSALFQKYFPETAKSRLERFARVMMCRLGIYSFVKRTVTQLKELKKGSD